MASVDCAPVINLSGANSSAGIPLNSSREMALIVIPSISAMTTNTNMTRAYQIFGKTTVLAGMKYPAPESVSS